MTDCSHLARTTAYFDGALAPAEHADLLAHLEGCVECQTALRDAATFDAILAQPPRRAVRRRAVLAVAGMAVAAAATIALWLGLGGRPPPAVAIALPRQRALEARFTGAQLGAYRPYDPLRGDRTHESIPLAALADLERRGEPHDLIAALAATGDLPRARELAAGLPADAASESDRAALALAAGALDQALTRARRATELDPALTAAWWNLALALRARGLLRESRDAFARVADRGEPGWSDEARGQIAALDRQLDGGR
jgi:tetratricopeptide (TPR) repeat protein